MAIKVCPRGLSRLRQGIKDILFTTFSTTNENVCTKSLNESECNSQKQASHQQQPGMLICTATNFVHSHIPLQILYTVISTEHSYNRNKSTNTHISFLPLLQLLYKQLFLFLIRVWWCREILFCSFSFL